MGLTTTTDEKVRACEELGHFSLSQHPSGSWNIHHENVSITDGVVVEGYGGGHSASTLEEAVDRYWEWLTGIKPPWRVLVGFRCGGEEKEYIWWDREAEVHGKWMPVRDRIVLKAKADMPTPPPPPKGSLLGTGQCGSPTLSPYSLQRHEAKQANYITKDEYRHLHRLITLPVQKDNDPTGITITVSIGTFASDWAKATYGLTDERLEEMIRDIARRIILT